MKNLIFSILFLPLFAFTLPNLPDIAKALNNGDAETLGTFFDTSIEISTPDDDGIFAKNEAIQLVKQFFAKNKTTSFKMVHKGNSKGKDYKYIIGNLNSVGTTYRVYIYMKVNNGNTLIQELRIEKE